MRPALSLAVAAVACLGVAGLSLLLPSAPTTDPWGWIVWGREVTHLDLVTRIHGAPSWKPMPVLFTTVFSLTGRLAPSLWLLLARAATLVLLLLTYRVAYRLKGHVAGVAAVLALVLRAGLARAFGTGQSEPIAAAFLMGAIDRELSARSAQAFVLGTAAALTRPEVWPLTLIYGAVRLRRPRGRLLLVAGAAIVPALWLIPDWLGAGDPFHGSKLSHALNAGGPSLALEAVQKSASALGAPTLLLAVVAVVLAAWQRERTILALAGWTALWTISLVALMLAGYPSYERFLFLPSTLVYLLAGVGAAGAVLSVRSRPARAAVAGALVAGALPFAVSRVPEVAHQFRETENLARAQADLRSAVRRLGGDRAARLGQPALPRQLRWLRGALVWEIGAHLSDVRAVRTSARGLMATVRSRSSPPWRSIDVALRPPLRPIVFFAPFGDARLHVAHYRGLRLEQVLVFRRWEVSELRASLPPASGRD